MKKIILSLLFIVTFTINLFATSTRTYCYEDDPKYKFIAHQSIALPGYLNSEKYSDLLSKGQEYEKAEKWIYAYGTYYDASLISDEDTVAIEKANSILSAIASGKPGKGKYDAFAMHDKWVELIEESERYFTEFPAFEIVLSSLVQKDLHYDTKTADYEVTIETYFTEKAKILQEALCNGFIESKQNDWNIEPWFYSNNFKSVVSQKVSYEDFKSGNAAVEKLKSSVSSSSKKGIAMASWLNTYNPYENEKRSNNNSNYSSQKPAFYTSISMIEKGWDTSMRFNDEYGQKSFYEIELALINKDSQVLAKSGRINIEELGSNKTKYLFKNLNREMMSQIDSGEVVPEVTNIYLHYGVLTIPSSDTKYSNELISNLIKKLPELKIERNKTVIYSSNEMLEKLDEVVFSRLIQTEPKIEDALITYGAIDGYNNWNEYSIYHPHFRAVANRISLENGMLPVHYQEQDGERIYDSSKWEFPKIEIKSSGYDRIPYDLISAWKTIKTDETRNGYFIEVVSGREVDWIRLSRRDNIYISNIKFEQERIAAEKAAKEKAEKEAENKRQEEIKKQEIHEYVKMNLPKMVSFQENNFEISDSFVTQELYEYVSTGIKPRNEIWYAHVSIFRVFDFCNKLSIVCGYKPVYKFDGNDTFEENVLWETDRIDVFDNQNKVIDFVQRISLDESANGFRLPSAEEFCIAFGFKFKKKATSMGGMGDETNVFSLSKSGKNKLNLFPDDYEGRGDEEEFCFYNPYILRTRYHYNSGDIKLVGLEYPIMTHRCEDKMQGYGMTEYFRLARTITK